MHPETKSVVPVILAGSSEHVDPDVVLAKQKKKQKEKKKRETERSGRKQCKSRHSFLKRFSICMTWRREAIRGRCVGYALVACNHPRTSLMGCNIRDNRKKRHSPDVSR